MLSLNIKPKRSELLEDDKLIDLRLLDTNITIDFLESKIKQRESPLIKKLKVLE